MKNIADRIRPTLPVVTMLILALLAAAPLWGQGLVNTRAGGDSPFLLWRTDQMAANLRAGVFPVRWMPDAAYGYGYPFFNYYSALPYYLAGLLAVVGVDILTAVKLTQTLGFVLAAWAMYGWTRRHFSRAGAWLAAVMYTFASFHLVNVYTRGDSLSEFYAFVFYPLILWGLDRTLERRDAASSVALGLALGGLIATHNLSAFIFAPFVLLYLLCRLPGSAKLQPDEHPLYHQDTVACSARAPSSLLKTLCAFAPWWLAALPTRIGAPLFKYARSLVTTLLPPALGLTLGVLLSAWVWLPAIGETRSIQLDEQTTGYFNYSNHFRRADLVQPTWAFDYDVGANTPFAMSSVQAALALLGTVAISIRAVRQRKLDRLSAFTLVGLVLSTAMITPLSRPLWANLPMLPLVQFPWRYLSAQAVFTALAAGQISSINFQFPIFKGATYLAQYAAVALGLLMAFASLANLRPTRLYIGPADVTTERLQLYELFTANIGTTIRYEWLPRQVVPRLYTSDALIGPDQPLRAVALEGEATATRLKTEPTRQTWRVTAGASGATVAFPILWWPGWQATVDGQATPIHPATSSGRIAIDVPASDHTLVLWLGRTPLRAVAESVSLAAVLVVLGLWLRPMAQRWATTRTLPQRHRRLLRKRGTKNTKVFHFKHFVYLVAWCLGSLVVIAVVMTARPAFSSHDDDETMDFVSQPYLHHNPEGQTLQPGLRLMSYTLSAETLDAGQTLNVRLDWRNTGNAENARVRLVSPAQHLVGLEGAPTLAESSAAIPSGAPSTHHTLSVSAETPRGLYLLQVQVNDVSVYLRPMRIENARPSGDAPALAQFDQGRLGLHRARAEQVTPDQLAVTLDWSAAQPVEENWAVAVRLRGVASLDTQPGYGFLPTSLWRPGELISDRYTLKIPEGTPPKNDYELEVILYDAATQNTAGQYVQPNVALSQYTRLPTNTNALAHFGPELALVKLGLPSQHEQGAPTLNVTAGWLATRPPSADRRARWTLYDAHGTAVLTHTADLAAGSLSSAWPMGAFVVGQTPLTLPADLAAGFYRVGVTVINPSTRAEEGHYVSPQGVELVGHPRSLTVPPMQQRADVVYGQEIKLLGYDLKSQKSKAKSQIALTLYWQAVTKPRGDYKVFVHLFNPADEKIAAQHDALPFNGRYPTSWWIAGEVISETITLDLPAMTTGNYRLAAGLYDPGTVTRLAAVGPEGTRLAADRFVLPKLPPGAP